MRKILLALMFLFVVFPTVLHATVASTVNKNTYSCDGANTAFDYTFPIISSTDIKLYLTNSSGVVSEVTTNFSVNTSGKYVTYPTSGTICAVGNTLTLYRSVPLTQSLVLTTQGPFPAVSLNTEHDKLTMMAQKLQEQIDRSLKLPITQTTSPSLPSPQAGYSLIWDSNGNLVNSNLVGPAGETGPPGPSGSGAGDVLGPEANTANYVPQWSGNDNRTLKNGLAIGTAANNLVKVGCDGKLPALDGSNLINVPVSVSSISGAALTSLGSIPSGAGSIPSANIQNLPDTSIYGITTAGKVNGSALTGLANTPFAAGKIPSANVEYAGAGTRVVGNGYNYINTVYQAATDLFLTATGVNGLNDSATTAILSDSANPPTVEVASSVFPATTGYHWSSISAFIKKGNYWEVTAANSTGYTLVNYIPIGN